MYRSSYTSKKLIPAKKNKHKLFALILKRSATRVLKENFQILKLSYENQLKAIKIISKNSQKNLQTCKLLAWQKLKGNTYQAKSQERIFKDIFILSKRLQMLAIRKAFHRIQGYVHREDAFLFKKMLTSRNVIMLRVLRKLQLSKKKQTMLKIENFCKFEKYKKRLSILPLIRKNLQKQLYLHAWSSLLFKMGRSLQPTDEKVEQLQIQVQDMKIQIQNRNENISRLNNEISELKENVSMRMDQNSFAAMNNHTKSYSSLNRSRAKYSFEKQSNDGSFKEESFGSLFSGSFFSKRSNNRSVRKNGQSCSCNSDQKCERYKNANQTLKKQLQIIKTELQFTKDMNEHMQNQIKQYFGGNDQGTKKTQKIKLQLKEVQRERDSLKEKVLKYEKYVGKLKMEFKLKIEEIYRKVRRNG